MMIVGGEPWMNKKRTIIWGLGSLAGIVVIVIGWWLLSPLWTDMVVNEASPVATSAIREKSEVNTNDEAMENAVKPMDGTKADITVMPAMLTGAFSGADERHQVEGKAIIVEADGKQYVRFENFEATNGPDLYVYLAKPGGVVKDGINLGMLKGNIGDQNYELPVGVDLIKHSQVVIYCKA
jgi:hypothetical protein